jgi:hypothetical protein
VTEGMSAKERRAAADANSAEKYWGMQIMPDPRVAGPERLAYEAYERGDAIFQIDLPVAGVQGYALFGQSATRTWRAEYGDVLGRIEQQGWRLEHVSTTFVTQGSSATKRVLANDGSTEVGTHGALIGLYVFRRGQRPVAARPV